MTLTPIAGTDHPTLALRHALKVLLRRCGLRCISVEEVTTPLPERQPGTAGT